MSIPKCFKIKSYDRKNSNFFHNKKERKLFFSILNTANCIDIEGHVLLLLSHSGLRCFIFSESEIFLKSLKRSFLMIARLVSSDHMALHVIIQTNTSNRLVKLLLGHCYVADPRFLIF